MLHLEIERAGYEELGQIRYGKTGSISTLKALIEAHPTLSKLHEYLAESYSAFDEHEKAATSLMRSATLATGETEKFRLLREAATAFHKAGKHDEATAVIQQMKLSLSGDEACEVELLKAERDIYKSDSDFEFQIGSLERQLELNPNDNDLRFELAHKYGEAKEHGLSALHYLRIPFSKRTANTWNNLGVAFNKLTMQAKSIEAYRRAEKMDGTLAMSNLANRLLDFGFLPEAKQICEVAAKIENYHENVGHSMSRLMEIPQEEAKEEIRVLENAQAVCDFYREFGKGSTQSIASSITTSWTGPHCELALILENDACSLTGKFERFDPMYGALASMSSGIGQSTGHSAITKHTIDYSGKIRGRSIVGWVDRDRKDESGKTSSLLTTEEDRTVMLGVFSKDGQALRVLEKPKTGSPKFYTIQAIQDGQGWGIQTPHFDS